MTDFIDGLEDDLVDAARRQAQARRTAGLVRRLRSSRRGLAVALVLLAGAGSATAAVVGLTSEPTKPLAGPRDPAPSSRAYSLSLLPDLRTGQAGWCALLRFTTRRRVTSAGMGCGPARSAGANLIAGGGVFGRRDGVQYAVVTARVRAVRFGDRVVETRADPALPNGWRFAIAVENDIAADLGTTVTVPPPTPGGSSSPGPATTMPPAKPGDAPPQPRRPPLSPHVTPVLLDANGDTLALIGDADRRARGAATRRVTKARPATRCAIGAAPGFSVEIAYVAVGRPRLGRPLEGRAFETCARTTFRVPGTRRPLTAVIWRDALDPARRADPLPPSPELSARRIGPAWIAAYGGNTTQRGRLLAQLRPHL